MNDDPSWVEKMGKSWKGQISTDTGFCLQMGMSNIQYDILIGLE